MCTSNFEKSRRAEEANGGIVAKLRKLLAMANHPGTGEAEAAAAMGRVQEILAKYNLDLAQVGSVGSDDSKYAKRAQERHSKAAMYRYQRDLMSVIAKNNFCMWWIDEVHELSFRKMRTVKRHVLLGSEVNVTVSTMLYDYLIETMDRLLPYVGMEKRGKNALMWLEGCAERLAERITDKRRRMEAESAQQRDQDAVRARHPGAAPTGALVLSDVFSSEDDLNMDHRRGQAPGTTARARKLEEAKNAAAAADRAAHRRRLEAEGLPEDLIGLMVWGYSRGEAEASLARAREQAPAKPESEAQRARRQEREERAYDAYQARQRRIYNKEQARRHDPAFQAGLDTGDEINLDDQINYEQRDRLA